ncbi:MAG: efflux RND transporter periplasmic adaptor subunit [Anaerolineales bacterium]|nr:efflux RND transporter periplasmic adaptor subunit [Anaerolineales bacterium]
MKFFKKRSNLVITGIVFAVIIGGALYFTQPSAADETATPELQTTKVRTGDLVITANGAGNIVPAAEVDIGFRSAGVVTELNVENGDSVTTAQILGRLEENIQAKADFQALFSAQGLAQAQLAVANAESALEDATNSVIYLVGSNAWYWEGQLNQAEAALNALEAAATSSQREEAQKVVDEARARMDYFLSLRNIPNVDITLARAEYESAKVALLDAQAALEIVQAGPEVLTAPIIALGTETAKLEQARLAVENTQLVAPFDGSVVALDIVKGQTVGTSPVMTIATTDRLLVRFYLDETDIDKAALGNPVIFTFDAYPGTNVTGEIVLVEPALQVVDGTPVVVLWASLPDEMPSTVISGMTVEAEVLAAEARNTLLVPVQALRELTPGSFAVFVVAPDGQSKMTPVEVGLRDFANAEILSGLKVDDVVSTGTVETK